MKTLDVTFLRYRTADAPLISSATSLTPLSSPSSPSMEHFDRSPSSPHVPPIDSGPDPDKNHPDGAFMKGPKRKRLAKACDACHKSKRRCDGTAPCSNCYFASKACTYTDASGRPVPAPRPFKTDKPEPQLEARPSSFSNQFSDRFPPSTPHAPQVPNSFSVASSSQPSVESAPENEVLRKRFRSGHGKSILASDSVQLEPPSAPTMPLDRPAGLDHSLTRELVNLFFTHCHPIRIIIHKPSFSSSLSHNRVPSYLLHAICALAAPLSKQPRIRTTPPRYAGKHFADEALAKIFDGSGRLICEPNLATAQALCLLQIQDVFTRPSHSSQYHDIALRIVENLGVHKPDIPTLTPVPSPEFIHASIERECVRRIFWVIHYMDLISAIYFKTPLPAKDNELMLRLPVDETSFELAVHSTLPEYLYLPAPRTQNASEFGHLIRVSSIYSKVEHLVDAFNEHDANPHPLTVLLELEQSLDSWVSSLTEQLRFSEENLQVQLSMFETSSNTGAWCFCCMHVLHASVALALNIARQRYQRGLKTEPQWALHRLNMIVSALGPRARNSVIMGAAIWSLMKYCKRDDPQIRTWAQDYEEVWSINIPDLISSGWRHQSQYPSHRATHTRTEPRHPVTSPITIPRPSQHRDSAESSASLKSSSPSPYPLLGRSFDKLRLHGHPAHAEIRSTGMVNDPRDRESRRMISDADIDPALQGTSSQRNLGSGDSPQSLPSLKASGLLDSWNPGKDGAMSGPWGPSAHSRVETQKVPLRRQSPTRRTPPPPSATAPHCTHYEPDSSRTSANGMPVGMPWLANESR